MIFAFDERCDTDIISTIQKYAALTHFHGKKPHIFHYGCPDV